MPSGPITRARSKKLQQAFIGLIQRLITTGLVHSLAPSPHIAGPNPFEGSIWTLFQVHIDQPINQAQ